MTFGQSDNKYGSKCEKIFWLPQTLTKYVLVKPGHKNVFPELMGYLQKPSNKFTTMCWNWGLELKPKVQKLYKSTECNKHGNMD